MSRSRPRALRSILLRGKNEMCRLSGRHSFNILFAPAAVVNKAKTERYSPGCPHIVHIWQECVDAWRTTLAPDSRHIVAF